MTTSSPPSTSPSLSGDALSPPPSPQSPFYDDYPVVATDVWGMIVEDGDHEAGPSHVRAVKQKRPCKRQPITYVSRHFTDEDSHAVRPSPLKAALTSTTLATPPRTPAKSPKQSRIYYGLNVDDLSSDSSLSSVPEDLGPDPFVPEPPAELVAVKTRKKRHPTTSPYFPHPHRSRSHFLSTLPFPPLSALRFGLMQERLAHDPFRLLIATIFLNKTPGERAMPIFFRLMERYPTPQDLASAKVEDVTEMIHELGFQNQRARKCVNMANMWTERPPAKGKRYRKVNYPVKGDGRDVKEDEVVGEGDERVAWEISHLPGLGPYSHDSWRMFCRDVILGNAEGWNGEGAAEGFEPEWKRVLPLDKELRAWLTWMWLKEGWVWNKETGNRARASEKLMNMARGGGIVVEEREKETLTVHSVDQDETVLPGKKGKVEKPAGEFLEDPEESR
jgi:methyl-CpG-binding domain protein 4